MKPFQYSDTVLEGLNAILAIGLLVTLHFIA